MGDGFLIDWREANLLEILRLCLDHILSGIDHQQASKVTSMIDEIYVVSNKKVWRLKD